MNLFSFVTAPLNTLWGAIAKPFQALFVVGVCYVVNQFTSPGNPWWHWVAFGMSISVIVAWARAFKTIVLLAAIFYVGRWIYRNYGDMARARFEAWVNGTGSPAGHSPKPSDAKDVLRLVGNDVAVRAAGIA